MDAHRSKEQPYFQLLEVLQDEGNKEEEKSEAEQKYIQAQTLNTYSVDRRRANMEEKLQGLTLEMKLDSLGVQEGMKGLKRQLGVVNSEMKANLSAFGKSEKSMAKYEALK